jgi:hypothetical protein
MAFILQMSSAIIIFGWIWSIKYGVTFVHLASKLFFSNKNVKLIVELFSDKKISVERN